MAFGRRLGVVDLKAAIAGDIAVANTKPKPFVRAAKASDILVKVARASAVLRIGSSPAIDAIHRPPELQGGRIAENARHA